MSTMANRAAPTHGAWDAVSIPRDNVDIPDHWRNDTAIGSGELETLCTMTPGRFPIRGVPPAEVPLPKAPLSAHTIGAAFPQSTPLRYKVPVTPQSRPPPPADLSMSEESLRSLHQVAAYGLVDHTNYLLRTQDVDLRDADGFTALHWAAVNARTEVVQALVQAKANVDIVGRDNQTALHWAAMQGHFGVCHALCEAKASIDAVDDYGFTPLLRAAQQSFVGVVRLLKHRGARVDVVDAEGHSSLHWAAHFGHADLAGFLLQFVGSPVINGADLEGNTPLHIACRSGHFPVAMKLIAHGANWKLKNVGQSDCLAISLHGGHNLLARRLRLLSYLPGSRRLLSKHDKSPWFLIGALAVIMVVYLHFCAVVLPVTHSEHVDEAVPSIVMLVLTPITLLLYWRSAVCDPGIVRDDPDVVMRKIADGGLTGMVCMSCMVIKPTRSKHCARCGVCIRCHDHHCVWINSCVGQANRLWFMTFTLTLQLCICLYLYTDAAYLIEMAPVADSNGHIWQVVTLLGDNVIAALLWVMTFVFGAFVTLVNVQLWSGIYMNMTTNERVNWTRYDHFRNEDGAFFNPFDRGPLRNTMDFFTHSSIGDQPSVYCIPTLSNSMQRLRCHQTSDDEREERRHLAESDNARG